MKPSLEESVKILNCINTRADNLLKVKIIIFYTYLKKNVIFKTAIIYYMLNINKKIKVHIISLEWICCLPPVKYWNSPETLQTELVKDITIIIILLQDVLFSTTKKFTSVNCYRYIAL